MSVKFQRNAAGKLLRNSLGKLIRGGSRCCCGFTCHEVTANFDSQDVAYIGGGNPFPRQGYILEYLRGAITYDSINAQGFRVNAISGGYYYAIVDEDGFDIAEAPPQGVYTEEASQADVEAANTGAKITFEHQGGVLGIRLHDGDPSDNALDLTDPSPSAPVFRLCPANHIQASYCSTGENVPGFWFIKNEDGTIRTTDSDTTALPYYFSKFGQTYKVVDGNPESKSPANLASDYETETGCPGPGTGFCGRCQGPFNGISISFEDVEICDVSGQCKSGGISQWMAEVVGGLGDYDLPDQGTGCIVCHHFTAPHIVSRHDPEDLDCNGAVVETFDEISIRVEVQSVFPTGFRIRVDVDIDHAGNCLSSVGGTTDYFRGLSSVQASSETCVGTYTVANTQPGATCEASGRLGRGGHAVVTIY